MASFNIKKINRNNGSVFIPTNATPTGLLELGSGDLLFGDDGDLVIASQDETSAQNLLAAIKTVYDVSPVFPNFGIRLRDLIGKTINIEILDEATQIFRRDLINSGFPIIQENTKVLAYDETVVILSVMMTGIESDKIQLTYYFDLLSGKVEEIGGEQI